MKPEIFIETPRLILRDWLTDDDKPFIDLNSDAEVMQFFPSVKTADETREQITRIKSHIKQHGFGFFAMERKDNGEFIGFTGLMRPAFEAHFTPCVEIGWRLNKKSWGYGYATEAGRACLEFGFEDLKFDKIYSFTAVQNIPSEKVMQRIGMVKEGYFDHPAMEDGHLLKKHVLYGLANPDV